jgi:hypothetical protein
MAAHLLQLWRDASVRCECCFKSFPLLLTIMIDSGGAATQDKTIYLIKKAWIQVSRNPCCSAVFFTLNDSMIQTSLVIVLY